ncbi:hypothetical protein B0H14DRAFT_3617270 [Mycena olivaceomarginata]|nr:hypothetical protein B0H14DRAFT_3617270 [Mycena olivaceomarginata]
MSVWNFTIEDTSPFLTYTPYADGSNSGLKNGWIPWYTTTGFLVANGDPGVGDSYHITSRTDASVALQFYGNSIYLYGTSNSSYTITLDSTTSTHAPPAKSESDLLFSATGLDVGTHSVTLSAKPAASTSTSVPAQQLAFDRAVISAPVIDNTPPTQSFYDNTDTTRLNYTGTWSTPSAAGIPNTSVTHPWHQTKDSGGVSMQIGRGAQSVEVRGMANWGNWLYSVSLDGAEASQYNGSTFWQVPDALLFYQGGLDPASNHTISLTNISPGMNFALNSIRVYGSVDASTSTSTTSGAPSSSSTSLNQKPPPQTSKHSAPKTGAIAGAVVGVLCLLALVVGGLLWWRRRTRTKARQQDMTQAKGYTYRSPHCPQFKLSLPPQSQSGLPLSATATTPADLPSSPSTATGVMASPIQGGKRNGASPTPLPSSHGSGSRLLGEKRQRRPVMATAPQLSPTPSSPTATLPTTAEPTDSSSPAPPAIGVGLAPSDVDRLIELIAQRIDLTGRRADSSRLSAPPPEYRG